MTLEELWERWGDELPLREAAMELDPPEPERIDNAAWQLARATMRQRAYQDDFDGTERPPVDPRPEAELKAEAEKIAKSWPNRK